MIGFVIVESPPVLLAMLTLDCIGTYIATIPISTRSEH